MKKFLFLLSIFLFIPFKVNALTDPVYFQSPIPATAEMYFNNYPWRVTEFKTVPKNQTMNIAVQGSFTTGMQFNSVYMRVSYCIDGGTSKGFSSDPQIIDIDTIHTSIPCQYYGSSYTGGHVAFTTWKYNIPSGTSFSGTVGVVPLSNQVSVGLLGLDLSLSQFPLYSETDAILKSNDSLNNRLQTIISQNNTLTYKIDDTNTKLDNIYNFLEDNFTTCRSGINLLNYSFSSPTTFNSVVYTLNSDKSITANGVPSSTTMFPLYGSSNQLLLEPGTYTLSGGGENAWVRLYNQSKQEYHDAYVSPVTFTISESTSYMVGLRISSVGVSNFTFYPMLVKGSSSHTYEPYGQVCGLSTLDEQKKLQEDNNRIQQDRNDFLNNDDVNESSSTGNDFFNNFNTSTHGLTGIITAPLNLITSITSKTCSPLILPLPFVNQNISLPCMSSIYSQYFGSFYDIYKIITFGIVAYWVCVRIFNLVKDFKNPEHDEIEVVDL